MQFPLRQLISVAAAGVMAMGVQAAQTTPSTSATGTQNTPSSSTGMPLNSDNPNAQAQADYQTAVKACSGMTGTERASCLRDARDARNRTMGTGKAGGDSTSSSGPAGAAGNGASGGQGAGTGSSSGSTSASGGSSSGSSSGSSGSTGK
jgi:hypothetical protein